MVNFALCFEYETELDFMKNELEKSFQQKGIDITIRCYRNAYEFEKCISCNCPDILVYDIESQDGLMRAAALSAKKENKNLISIITQNRNYKNPIEDILLEPIYKMPDKSRRHLLSYASLAYEALLDDENSFSYYVRPDYIHIPVEDIRYFASEGRRTHVICGDFRDTFYQKLDTIERHIKNKNANFLRIHKSYLINAAYISSYNRDYVTLTNGEKLRISRYEYYRLLNDKLRLEGQKRLPRYSNRRI